MKAFIFDFDGVIVDTQNHWDSSTMELYQSIIPTWGPEDNFRLRGTGVHDIYDLLVNEYNLKMEKQEFLDVLDVFALDMYLKKSNVIPGIDDLMGRLDALHIPKGIATASRSHWLESALKKHGIHHRFEAFTCADDTEKNKPDPEVYLLTAQKMNVDPKECVALEDSLQGMTAAKAAGMFCIGFQGPEHLFRAEDLSKADMIIAHPDELTEKVLLRL